MEKQELVSLAVASGFKKKKLTRKLLRKLDSFHTLATNMDSAKDQPVENDEDTAKADAVAVEIAARQAADTALQDTAPRPEHLWLVVDKQSRNVLHHALTRVEARVIKSNSPVGNNCTVLKVVRTLGRDFNCAAVFDTKCGKVLSVKYSPTVASVPTPVHKDHVVLLYK